jgi:quinol monooxygenase YgiN
MIIVKGEARFAPGEIERLREPLNSWIAEVRGRDGCLSYCYAVDLGDPDMLHVIETWESLEAIDRHMADMGPLMEVLAGAQMLSLKVNAYDATFARTLMGE